MNRLTALSGTVFLYQRGRVLALALLLLFAGVIGLVDAAPPGNTLLARTARVVGAPLAEVREMLFDGYQRTFPRVRQAQTVAIVGIDENSLKTVGQWPWPRNQLAELVDAIAALGPAAIGLDIYMPEPDQTSPEQVARRMGNGQPAVVAALMEMPGHDARLAQSLRAAPTVLGAAGFDFRTLGTSEGLTSANVLVHGGDAVPLLRRFPFVLASLPPLQVAAHGQALVSIDETAVVRRIPLVAAVRETVVPSFAIDLLRVASGSTVVDVNVGRHGIRSVAVADMVFPTQEQGDVWLHFAPEAQGRDTRNISAASLLAGRVARDAVENKLVLIGLTGLGLNDRRVTPLGESVPGIEIHAQLLESMLDGRMLLRPWWMAWAELALFLAIGTALVWRVPRALRRRGLADGRNPPHVGLWVMGIGATVLMAGFWMFWRAGWLFDGASMAIGFAAVLAVMVSSSTLEIQRDNRRLAIERQQLREESARLAGEMEAARRIQLGSLPNAQRAFPGERRFAVDALIEPAREVGGDLYDFFLIDARRLYFLIGDVSGKGVPASLFMAVTKALTRSFAARLPGGPAEIVSSANRDLSRENVETLFVTLLLGVLDVESGVLELVNAGHDAPWRLGADGGLEQMVGSPQSGGPPLCVVDDFDYQVQRIQLRPGDRLCMVTDGITEAADAGEALYGSERLRAALSTVPPGSSVADITRCVRADVADFVAGAEASDDLAVLVLHWPGPPGLAPA